jgi:hypothetical protein
MIYFDKITREYLPNASRLQTGSRGVQFSDMPLELGQALLKRFACTKMMPAHKSSSVHHL